jgi:hypothetical protein
MIKEDKMENKIDMKCCCPPDSRAWKVLRIIGMVFIGVIFAILFALVFGFLVKWLWNFLMPGLFGLSRINYLQAFAMVVLAKLLFGAFGPHHPRHPHMPPHHFERFHDRFMCHMHAPWDNGSKMKHFSQYWQEEGKEAFNAYIKKTEAQGKDAENG